MKYDEVMEKAGGFGRFQILATLILITTKMTGDFVINVLTYNELLPDYLCRPIGSTDSDAWYECTNEDFCPSLGGSDQIEHKVDWNSPTSLHNWVERMDLTCNTKG